MTFTKPQLGIFCSLVPKFLLPTAQGSSSITDAELKNQYYFEEEALINKQSILNQVASLARENLPQSPAAASTALENCSLVQHLAVLSNLQKLEKLKFCSWSKVSLWHEICCTSTTSWKLGISDKSQAFLIVENSLKVDNRMAKNLHPQDLSATNLCSPVTTWLFWDDWSYKSGARQHFLYHCLLVWQACSPCLKKWVWPPLLFLL